MFSYNLPTASYALPTILSLLSLLGVWFFSLFLGRFLNNKFQKWQKPPYRYSVWRSFVASQKTLIEKSLTFFRRIVSLYIVLSCASHVLQLLGTHLKSRLGEVDSSGLWMTLGDYAQYTSHFLEKGADVVWTIFCTGLAAIWCLRIVQKALDVVLLSPQEQQKNGYRSAAKKKTISNVINHFAKIIIFCVAIFIIMQSLGVNIAALLATAGLASVAIGLGAQNLVKDVIAGFFILMEDQFAVGDTVDLGTPSGLFTGSVERLTIRMVRLRSTEGSLVTLPNSDVRTVKNYSTDWARIDYKFNMPLSVDMDEATRLFELTVNQLYDDYPADILAKPDIRPLEKIVDFENRSVAATLRAYIKTRNNDWKVKLEMELNKRLLRAFQELHIPVHTRS